MFLLHVYTLNNRKAFLRQHLRHLSPFSFIRTREYDNIVSFFYMHKPVLLHHFRGERNNLFVTAFCDLARDRAKDATRTGLILRVNQHDRIFIEANV